MSEITPRKNEFVYWIEEKPTLMAISLKWPPISSYTTPIAKYPTLSQDLSSLSLWQLEACPC